jgi:hypothetical protein
LARVHLLASRLFLPAACACCHCVCACVSKRSRAHAQHLLFLSSLRADTLPDHHGRHLNSTATTSFATLRPQLDLQKGVCQRPPTHQQQLFPREPSSRHRFHFSPPVMSSAANTASTKSITTGNHFVRLLLHIEPHEVANPSDPSSSTSDNRSDPATPITSSWIAQSMPPLPWPLPTRDGARSSGAHRQLEDAPSRLLT